MATVKDTATGDVYEGVTGLLLAYYRGEGDRFEITEDATEVSLPVVHQQDGTVTVGAEQVVKELSQLSAAGAAADDATAQLSATIRELNAQPTDEAVPLQPEQPPAPTA